MNFSPDGERIVSASSDETAKVWSVRTGKEIAELKGHSLNVVTAVFSPDGSRILTTSLDDMAKLWEAKTGREIITIFKVAHEDDLMGGSFSNDGRSVYFLTRLGNVHKFTTLPWDRAEYNCAEDDTFIHCLEVWKRRQRLGPGMSADDVAWK